VRSVVLLEREARLGMKLLFGESEKNTRGDEKSTGRLFENPGRVESFRTGRGIIGRHGAKSRRAQVRDVCVDVLSRWEAPRG
jgi:hypothetical protein